MTSIAATTPGRAAAAAASAPERFPPLPVIVTWVVYIVVASQTNPRSSGATVPVATGSVSVTVASWAMRPAWQTRP